MPTLTKRSARNGASRINGREKPVAPKTEAAPGGRSIWRGAISFGLVAIPVRLFPATSNKDLSFHLLHEKCNSRIKQLKWCPKCDREVDWDEIVKGYEYSPERYVRVTAEDFENV